MNNYKILVASDSHGRVDMLMEAISRNPDLDAVIFLGDGISDMEFVSQYFRARACAWYAVKGNCDFERIFRDAPLEKTQLLEIGGKRILYTHGDAYGVKLGMEELYSLAERSRADIVLYGHTHRRSEEYRFGKYFVNPGSLHSGEFGRTCAILTIDGDSVLFSYLMLA